VTNEGGDLSVGAREGDGLVDASSEMSDTIFEVVTWRGRERECTKRRKRQARSRKRGSEKEKRKRTDDHHNVRLVLDDRDFRRGIELRGGVEEAVFRNSGVGVDDEDVFSTKGRAQRV
jgi:hypothetical protein